MYSDHGRSRIPFITAIVIFGALTRLFWGNLVMQRVAHFDLVYPFSNFVLDCEARCCLAIVSCLNDWYVRIYYYNSCMVTYLPLFCFCRCIDSSSGEGVAIHPPSLRPLLVSHSPLLILTPRDRLRKKNSNLTSVFFPSLHCTFSPTRNF